MSAEERTKQTIKKHIAHVQDCFRSIINHLSIRAHFHDMSKLMDDEFNGFIHFERLDPNLEYGSPAYKEAFKEIEHHVQEAIKLHHSRNDHHPEYHDNVQSMNFLQILEMVCDWKAACQSYSDSGSFRRSVEIGKQKYDFSKEQLWLIDQVADLLEGSE